MSGIVCPRSVMMLPIANVALPITLILFILLAGGVVFVGILLGIASLFKRFSRSSEERTEP
ncbi:hypothetical protein [Natronolimnobius baerhuensis]|uniref:Uncharacterized protein n=1 Tax=Natronolimnobius baerhuensis TaxID=253108 RepID=A0A202EC04_9EURY|nr:hypothetical protein [Natronolimnobius baerhuensis]OVE85752.1 hypothetical protein B2G88_02745 [Natronolimnobius baerhuensis]